MKIVQKVGLISLIAILLGGCAAPNADVRNNALVDVQFADNVWRDDSRFAMTSNMSSRRSAEIELRKHLADRAGRALPAGQKLKVIFTRIDRAGDFEPWRHAGAQDVRIVRDIYPPRIDLTFLLSAADGRMIRTGNSQLRDQNFLMRSNVNDSDPLRFEKTLLDDWVRKELPRNR